MARKWEALRKEAETLVERQMRVLTLCSEAISSLQSQDHKGVLQEHKAPQGAQPSPPQRTHAREEASISQTYLDKLLPESEPLGLSLATTGGLGGGGGGRAGLPTAPSSTSLVFAPSVEVDLGRGLLGLFWKAAFLPLGAPGGGGGCDMMRWCPCRSSPSFLLVVR